MLVGDYCPRALDPVFLFRDDFLDEVEDELSRSLQEVEALKDLEKAVAHEDKFLKEQEHHEPIKPAVSPPKPKK